MVLAAGFGTRLRPLTEVLPKPAVPVANRPALAYSVGHLARAGVKRIVVNTHYLPEQLESALEGHIPHGVELRFVHESDLLGTGGGLANAWPLFDDAPVIVMNSDIVYAPDINALMDHHRASNALATMSLREDPRAQAYGAIELDRSGRVRKILGRPQQSEGAGELKPYMFAGVHILSPEVREDLPSKGCIVRDCYMPWTANGRVVAGLVESAPWHDLGSVRLYFDTSMGIASGAITWPGIRPQEEVGIVDSSAQVDSSATLRDCIIGPRCKVGAGVHLERCIVWAGAEVQESASEMIFTVEGAFEVPPVA